MSDGQDKSDDLIAELAKLMASSAGGAEPEAKPGPKLVSTPEPSAEPRPAAPTIRIPGMDAPVAASPQASAAPAVPVTPEAGKPATPAPTIRIPGMDQPVAATPRPAPAAPAVSAAPEAKPEPRTPSIDFGALPPAATIRPEPLSNWQDREIPKPVAARPPAVSEPVLTPPAPAPKPAAPAPAAVVVPPAPTPVRLDEPEAAEAADVESDEPIIAGKPAPEGDGFDFDFGFGSEPPGPIDEQPRPAAVARTATPMPATSSDDPIADLIAAELDAAEDEAPVPVPARPPVQPPVIRSFPAATAVPQPQQQRAVTTNPVRPPVAPAVAQPKPAPEPDRFATAPVFGLGGKPANTPAPAERDPMDEIESLIGEAVRVELTAPDNPAPVERPKPAAAPVVPPLTTGFAPRRAAIKEAEPQIASAEAAILAAAAASGADAGHVDSPVVADAANPYKRPKAKAEKRSFLAGGMRQYVGMAVAGTLLLAAGFGLYWVLGMGRATDAEAPVLTADASPVKEVPPVAPPKEDAQGSVVFNELGGGSAAPPADEQLVSRDDSAETSVADVAQTVGDGDGAVDAESELANRKVRTVTVRPDGTIVSGDDAVAGSEALPVDRPNVPEVPGAGVQPSELLAALPDNTAANGTDPVAGAIDAASTGTAQPAAAADTGPAPNIDPNVIAPVPMARPANRAALHGGSGQRVAATDASAPIDLTAGETPAAAPSAPVSSGGGAYVQLSSQPTTADAQASLRTTQNRLAGILNGRSLEIRQVDLGAKGVWYRVVLPVNSFADATRTCASFKANGTDCVPING